MPPYPSREVTPLMRTVAVAVAAAAALSFTSPADAAPKPQIVDATGDAPAGAGYDVVSALFTTAGSTAKVGRKTVYTPTKLVVVVTYAGNVAADAYATQVVTFDAPGCDDVYLQTYSGGTFASADCLEDPFDVSVKTSGKTVTFTVPFGTLGKQYLKPGAVLSGLATYTALAEPVLGYETGELTLGTATVDTATTDKVYKIA